MTHHSTRNTKRPNATAFRDAVDEHMKKRGENGCPEFTDLGLGSPVLAVSQLVRGGDPRALILSILQKASTQEIADLFVLLFATRNTRGGKGEKKLAYDIYLKLFETYPVTAMEMVHLFPHFGYWKDLLLLLAQAKGNPIFAVYHGEAFYTKIMTVIKEQLVQDIAAVEQYKKKLDETTDEDELEKLRKSGPSISLLAKWLPREGKELDKKTGFVNRFAPLLLSVAEDDKNDNTKKTDIAVISSSSWESTARSRYRKTVVELTSYLQLPEVLLALHREEEICFERVASRATMNLRHVFLNEDKDNGQERSRDPKRIKLAERFTKFVVEKGLKGGQLMPHEIVEKILANQRMSSAEELVLDAQWKNLWENVLDQVKAKAAEEGGAEAADFDPTRMVPLSDVSGSMSGTPMAVAIALGIGISEITHDAFKNMVLTFETTPCWHRLNPGDSIVKKVRSLENAPWDCSTNFEAAYDLILDVAVKAGLAREDMPSLIVFSDMQFNQAATGCYSSTYNKTRHQMDTMHDHIRQKVATAARTLGWEDSEPTPIVYWNLRNTGGHPVDKDTEGAVLLSGFSASMLKLVMYGDALKEQEVEVVQADGTTMTQKIRVTPEQILRKMLDDSLYDPVREVLVKSQEGKLKEYGGMAKRETKNGDEEFEMCCD